MATTTPTPKWVFLAAFTALFVLGLAAYKPISADIKENRLEIQTVRIEIQTVMRIFDTKLDNITIEITKQGANLGYIDEKVDDLKAQMKELAKYLKIRINNK